MADAPLRRVGAPFGLIVIIVLIAIMIVWLAAGPDEDEPDRVVQGQVEAAEDEPGQGGQETAMAGGPEGGIRDAQQIFNAQDKDELHGKYVRLEEVRAREVRDDVIIAEAAGRPILVTRQKMNLPQSDAERGKRYEEKPSQGQAFIVRGELRRFPSVDEATSRWDLDRDTAEKLSQAGVYIEADEINPLSDPENR